MAKNVLLLLCGIALGCCACGPTTLYEERLELPAEGWSYADSARFAFTVEDTAQAYHLVLSVQHAEDFAHQNFYVRLHTGFPSGVRTTEQLSLQLAGDFGAWLGNCSGGNCTLAIPILAQARFSTPGPYSLTVEQYSRENPLPGVGAISLAVTHAD